MPGPAPRRAALAAAIVSLLVSIGVSARLSHPKPLPVPAREATRIAAGDAVVRSHAARATSTAIERVDDDLERVTFLRHGRVLAAAGVRRDRTISDSMVIRRHLGYGTELAHAPLGFAIVTLLFLAAVLRRPLRRAATADALMLAAFIVPTVLVDRGYVLAGQGTAALLLAGLAARAVMIVARGAPQAAGGRPLVSLAAVPRLPLLLGGALGVALVGMTLCSTGEMDVAYASMEGATTILHGVLPYGHLSGDVLHGDTYGLPVYLAYVPFAALWPVTTTWDPATGAMLLAAICALATAWAVARAVGGDRSTAILLALAFPPVLLGVTSGTNDVLIAAALAWALAWAARSGRSSGLIAVAGLAKIAPLALLPAWIAQARGRDRVRAIAISAALFAGVLVVLLALGGPHAPADMARAIAFQFERRSINSVYVAFGIESLQPVVMGLAVALAIGGAVLFALDDEAAADPRRLAALAAGTLALLELAAHYWTPLYLLWLLPPAAVALLAGQPLSPSRAPRSPTRTSGRSAFASASSSV